MNKVWAGLRSTVFMAYMVLTVIPWATVAVLASLVVPQRWMYRICATWLGSCIHAARWICGVRWRVQGMQHVPSATNASAAVLLAAKHQSTWETFAFPMLMPHPLAYVFKRELLWIPFFGWSMARLDMVHIDRSRRAQAWAKVAEQGQRIMGRGTWVIMFPEGTRIARGEQGNYKSGATRLAITAGVPVVPIAVASARCWPRKSFLLRPGVVDVSIGPPIHPAGREPDELMREVEAWIETEMRRIDPEAYSGPYSGPPARLVASAAAPVQDGD